MWEHGAGSWARGIGKEEIKEVGKDSGELGGWENIGKELYQEVIEWFSFGSPRKDQSCLYGY